MTFMQLRGNCACWTYSFALEHPENIMNLLTRDNHTWIKGRPGTSIFNTFKLELIK